MVNPYTQFLPSAADLVTLPVEMIAIPALRILAAKRDRGTRMVVMPDYLANRDDTELRAYAGSATAGVVSVLAEAWAWLYAHGMLAPDVGSINPTAAVLTRAAERALIDANPVAWVSSQSLMSHPLDAELATEVLPSFVVGRFDSAVRDAFRRVEVRLRTVSGLRDEPKSAAGMAGAAFRWEEPRGPLAVNRQRDTNEIKGERDLVQGAMARFRNPVMHGDVGLDDPHQAVELILFANLLLRLIGQAATEAGRPNQ